MTADAAGNDILNVGVPLGGYLGVGPFGTTLPTAAQGKTNPLTPVLNVAIKKIGLMTTDGGFQFAWAADGDPIEFWQFGYSIPSGLAKVTLTIKSAEALSDNVRTIVSGTAPTADAYTTIDGGGTSNKYVLFTEEVMSSGAIRRRAAGNATLQSVSEDKSTRGSVEGQELVFGIDRFAGFGNDHIAEWVIPAT